jgi:hypothetical protein
MHVEKAGENKLTTAAAKGKPTVPADVSLMNVLVELISLPATIRMSPWLSRTPRAMKVCENPKLADLSLS